MASRNRHDLACSQEVIPSFWGWRCVEEVLESIRAVMIQLHKETVFGFQISELPLLLISSFLNEVFDTEMSSSNRVRSHPQLKREDA